MLEKLLKINWLIIFLLLILSSIGFMSLYSAAEGNLDPWAKKQMIRFSLGLIILFIVAIIDIRIWYKHAYHIFILSIILLLGVELFGIYVQGAQRWINFFGFSIQPSEFSKVSLILVLARYYHDLRFLKGSQLFYLIPPLILILLPFFLILNQPDLGTSITILILGISIIFLAGIKIWIFIISSILFIISFPIFWIYVLKEYQKNRILSFLNPELDPLGSGYHLMQSKIALGSGGVYGKGFLKGSQSYLDFLPEKQTDFIFTMIGEEFGFLGTVFILILYALMILTCLYVALQSFSTFGRLIAVGIGINLFLYVFLNTAMVIGILPIVGIPLPLLSYGGTVMLSILISFGFLQNVSINFQNKNFS